MDLRSLVPGTCVLALLLTWPARVAPSVAAWDEAERAASSPGPASAAADDSSAESSADARSDTRADSSGRALRVERFVLWTRTSAAGVAARPEIAGFAEWRQRETKSGLQLECDVRFLRTPVTPGGVRDVERVLHVEQPSERGTSCVWREVGPGTGRSVQAEWSADGRGLEIAEWSAAGKRRGTLVAPGGASTPLYLVELLRQGGLASGQIVRFDPLARTLDPLEVRTVWLDDGGPLASEDVVDAEAAADGTPVAPVTPTPRRALRTVELVRADGSLAARYRFAGHDLLAFQWQESPLVARAVTADEYERLTAEYLPRPPEAGER